MRTIHPEIAGPYLMNLADISRKEPHLTYEIAKDKAWITTWNDCMQASNKVLEDLLMMPITAIPLEDYERYLQEQECIDDFEEAFEEEEF